MVSQISARKDQVPTAVIAVVATFQRSAELQRLLHSLESARPDLLGVIIVDNADDIETAKVLTSSPLDCRRIVPEKNLGCAGGLEKGGKTAAEMFHSEYTHLWILDDDAVVPSGTLQCLLAAMAREQAWAAIPLIVDHDGRIGWFPHLLKRSKFNAIRRRPTLDEFWIKCGREPELFSWCTGVSLLVARTAVEQLGFHRGDYWVRGEDLEYSLRLTGAGRGILVPDAVVQHLPPPPTNAADQADERAKHAAMLRNLAFTSFRLSHGRSLIWKLPGNWWRFLRMWGCKRDTITTLFRTMWDGALRGSPAGAETVQRP
ncbi:MAG: glycosyltransferase [Verrucomicrobiaceae bacterium]|nr:MAG: glycosyltransferase [Verrucomicrobiaceae bacterium]